MYKRQDLHYAEGDVAYYDTYLGGTHFAGTEVLWRQGTPIWAMNYCGRVFDERFWRLPQRSALTGVRKLALSRTTALSAWINELSLSGDGQL